MWGNNKIINKSIKHETWKLGWNQVAYPSRKMPHSWQLAETLSYCPPPTQCQRSCSHPAAKGHVTFACRSRSKNATTVYILPTHWHVMSAYQIKGLHPCLIHVELPDRPIFQAYSSPIGEAGNNKTWARQWCYMALSYTFAISVRPRFWLTKTHKLDEN